MNKISPMMQQYLDIKKQYEDEILFFRLGDFYEMFFEDAIVASKELEIALTGKDCGLEERAPMCGVPYHSYENYVSKLIKRGYKVAICEQVEDPKTAKGVVKREVRRVITKGTLVDGNMLDEASNSYICCLYENSGEVGLSFCDSSTGELYSTHIDENISKSVEDELCHYMPSEILFFGKSSLYDKISGFAEYSLKSSIEKFDESKSIEEYRKIVSTQFPNQVPEDEYIICSVALLIEYLKKTQVVGLERIENIKIYNILEYMSIDSNTTRNLELITNTKDHDRKNTLLSVLDRTQTSMGKRLIKQWIQKPLLNIRAITKRHDAVEELANNRYITDCLTESLNKIYDIERIMTKIVYGSANARDLRLLSSSISILPEIKKTMQPLKCDLLKSIYENTDELLDIYQLIDKAIVEEPPATNKDGGFIKEHFDETIDYLNNLITNSQKVIIRIEEEERLKTGIPKLKIGYNRVFGYYIEITNLYKDYVPNDYIRKQTLTNSERYITEELKKVENELLGAKDKVLQREVELFEQVRQKIAIQVSRIQNVIKQITVLDVLISLSVVATRNNYCRATMYEDNRLILKNSRHPVVEKAMKKTDVFVPNDVLLDTEENRVNIITGPNMAGKSTYMRQVALIVIMAQIGSFVPADKAEIGIVDKIFTRVGAADDLASGRSTFMVEMTEVAYIVENATKNSLLILDEIGRGTSTFDGMSIAQAVLEYVAEKNLLGAKTLFATHYHELTELENVLDGVKNYNILVKKHGDDITFLRKIAPGKSDDSYGIQVAKLAGLPECIITRAKEILAGLEATKVTGEKITVYKSSGSIADIASEELQRERKILEKLKRVDINSLTPLEAMNILSKVAQQLK